MSLVNFFDPSNWAAFLLGPKAFIPFFVNSSTIPFTRGISGPCTTKSIFFSFENQTVTPKVLIYLQIKS